MNEEKKFELISDFMTVFRSLDKVDREKVEDGIFPLCAHMAKETAHSYALHENDMENAERKYCHDKAERVYKFFYALMEECYREDDELAEDETEEEEAELCKGSFTQEIAKIYSAELREARKNLGKEIKMRKYDYGALHFLRAEDKEKLLRLAEESGSYKDFLTGCGWMDWMQDFCDSPYGGELTEKEVKRIEDVQREAWCEAHK